MPYPAYIAEVAAPRNRPQLWIGVWSGYGVVIVFLALALIAHVASVVEASLPFYALLGVKLVTNTALWWSLRTDRGVMETSGLNVLTDLVLMTAAIYLSGGPQSPLFAIYVVELGVIALLTNLGVTLITAAVSLALYASMLVAVSAGLLEPMPPPGGATPTLTTAYLMADLARAAVLLGIPTFFTGAILGRLRAKEAALAETARGLVEAGEAKARFMATVTHELRTPMHGILGLTEMLEAGLYGPMTEDQARATRDIRRATLQLQQLIEDLLELTRADAGGLEVRPTQVAPAPLVEQVLASARWMLESREDLAVESHLAADLPELTTDPRLVAAILMNLLSNAVKFTPDGGRIDVRASADGDGVALAVEDDGIGIAAEQRARIFETFRQGDDSVERAYGGAGLGLALVQRLVEVLGGSVTVRSEVGEGSCFTVRLPRACPEGARAPTPTGQGVLALEP